ncbi:sodium:solute symporter family protein [Thermanaerosceptrum fracticalcis]|uniref:Sodium:solute symporter family protein n=1 Tax=Thermanaerosceptrum fracticalcis TaxID=1712410 RepID=A0A7G6DYX7_THEFR|nr:sodium:solute symporter family protein [Thermanaerosceptrum fracticalcis]QNB45031.1 sodium:solute symporter family protein [Thermanaerosceptrum fracticalcis]
MALSHNPSLLWYVIGYGLVMVIIGIIYSKKIHTSEDFILAGRSLGPLVLMGTLIATWCGSGTVTGGPNSLAYSFGLWPGLLYTLPSIVGIFILYIIGPKIREYGKYTVSEILEDKFGTTARSLAGIIIILAYVGIVSYQFKGLGFILNVTTGISVDVGTILGALLIIFLAFAGGLVTVAVTDAISAFLMLFGLMIAVPAVINAAGGWDKIVANVPPQNLTFFGSLTPLQLIGYYLPLLFLLLGDQNMYQRLAASKGTKEAKIGMKGWFVGLLILSPAVALIAFAARAIFPKINPGMALISTTLVIPTFVGGMLLAAAAAFIVTTGNSYLLSAATNVTYDIYGRYINPNATDKEKLFFTKALVPVLGIIAYVMIRFFPTILAVQMYSYTVYAAGITPAVLAVFLWKRVTKPAGISSMLAGVITTLLWEIPLGKPFALNSSVISVPVAILVLIIVTLITTPQTDSQKNITIS